MKEASLTGFKTSLSAELPPEHVSVYVQSLWWAGKGNWEKSHNLIQDVAGQQAARIHAYLHRLEGDHSNAQYWYTKANAKMPVIDTSLEWENLVEEFVAGQG